MNLKINIIAKRYLNHFLRLHVFLRFISKVCGTKKQRAVKYFLFPLFTKNYFK